MNQRLANNANSAITNDSYDDTPGHCEVFAREVIQHTYGTRFNDYFRASARLTALAFRDAGLGFNYDGDPTSVQVGDVFYKTEGSGPFGHVGIYVGDKVAENSSTQIGRVSGAKGYRAFPGAWGAPQIIVRLAVVPRLILGFEDGNTGDVHYEIVPGAELINGAFIVNSEATANLLGIDASKLSGGTAPLRQVLAALGVGITNIQSMMDDPTDPREYVFVA